jgi:hypothetical protein
MKKILAMLIIAIVIASCSKHTKVPSTPTSPSSQVEFTGTVQKQGMTTYQYGDYVISDDKTTYALKSTTVNLGQYLNKKVTIWGDKVQGYPLEGGPDFLDVKKVKE